MKQPNPRVHFYISLVKSALRIVAGVAFMHSCLTGGGIFLILAEALGILEEVF
jgi:hypothetical protein